MIQLFLWLQSFATCIHINNNVISIAGATQVPNSGILKTFGLSLRFLACCCLARNSIILTQLRNS